MPRGGFCEQEVRAEETIADNCRRVDMKEDLSNVSGMFLQMFKQLCLVR